MSRTRSTSAPSMNSPRPSAPTPAGGHADCHEIEPLPSRQERMVRSILGQSQCNIANDNDQPQRSRRRQPRVFAGGTPRGSGGAGATTTMTWGLRLPPARRHVWGEDFTQSVPMLRPELAGQGRSPHPSCRSPVSPGSIILRVRLPSVSRLTSSPSPTQWLGRAPMSKFFFT